jgi:hypothetical protein
MELHTGRHATVDPERFDPPTAHNGFSHLQSRDVDAYLGLTGSDAPLASVSPVRFDIYILIYMLYA